MSFSADQIRRQILQESRTLAIVGLSANPQRTSYQVAKYLQENGYRIIPVNPKVNLVLGEKAYPTLSAIPFPVDLVDVFRRESEIPDIIDEALNIKCPVIWLQLGLECPTKREEVQKRGAIMIENSCLKVEHQRLLVGQGDRSPVPNRKSRND